MNSFFKFPPSRETNSFFHLKPKVLLRWTEEEKKTPHCWNRFLRALAANKNGLSLSSEWLPFVLCDLRLYLEYFSTGFASPCLVHFSSCSLRVFQALRLLHSPIKYVSPTRGVLHAFPISWEEKKNGSLWRVEERAGLKWSAHSKKPSKCACIIGFIASRLHSVAMHRGCASW